MKSILFLFLLIGLALPTAGLGSSIHRITLAELQSTADLIVLAKVAKVEKQRNVDHVTIDVDSYLKGRSTKKTYTFVLVTRGGLKDFDPSLKSGDSGVFFLKRTREDGHVEKAYWGGVAVFPKDHFTLTDQEKR